MQRNDKEYNHGVLAIEAARMRGIFPSKDERWIVKDEVDVNMETRETQTRLDTWRHQLETLSDNIDDNGDPMNNDINHTIEGNVVPMSDLWMPFSQDPTLTNMQSEDEPEDFRLNDDQQRAYDIVNDHLQETLSGKMPQQLLMIIPGEGGVGKTKVVQSIVRNFHLHGVDEWCVKGAYTGIAASLINGKTLHVLAGIPIRGGKQSAQTKKRLREYWRTKRYLIIDEISMLSRTFFARFCRIISTAMENNEDEIFGGLNVILVGDFHQFPPVVARTSAPLYWPINSRSDSEDDIFGRKIFEEFTTVVQLKTQIRVQDAVWQDVLQHVRYGNCRQNHINIIRSLVITDPNCPLTNFDTSPWKDARLVTPRHAVRNQWNSAAIRKHCAERHCRLYVSSAEETIGGRPVTNEEKIAIMTKKKGSKSEMERGGLMKDVELAIGASVMVTLNIHTELDVANGVRGTIEGIVLDD
jgi:PIF1-like helicase